MFVPLINEPLPNGDTDPWSHLHVPTVAPTGWSEERVMVGLRALERIRREADAATAVLIGGLPDDRDVATRIARLTGISAQKVRAQRAVAAVVAALPAAQALLASGAVSSEHIEALRPVIGLDGADALALTSIGTTPEAFRREVERFRLSHEHGDDAAARQRVMRRLRFFDGPEGTIGFSGLLPPHEGATLKAMLDAIVDARWKAEHPERARVIGGHGGDSREQRLADALLELTGVAPTATTAAGAGAAPHGAAAGADASAGADAGAGAERYGDSETEATESEVSDLGARPCSCGASRPTQTRVTTAKPATVVVFDIDKYEAEMIDHGPVPVTASIFDQTRAQLYLYFTNQTGEILKFGRARRDPTLSQRLAVIVRDRRCSYPGCEEPSSACSIHHLDEWLQDNGLTDVEVLALFCDRHHRHLHVKNLKGTREADGTVTITDRATGTVIARASPRRAAA